jgi:hypothetical protein
MNTRHPVDSSVRTAVGFNSRVRRYVLFALLMLTGAICIQATAAATTAAITLAPLTPDSATVEAKTGDPVELSVSKQIDGKGMPDQSVDWTISGPDSASVTPTSSMTSSKDETNDAGIARTVFSASAPGSYVVIATTQDNPGCSGNSCATYINSKFTIQVADKVTDSDDSADHGHKVLDAAIATGLAAVILANNGGNHETAVTPTLAISSGDNQSAVRNGPLANGLIVVAKNNGVDANGVVINWSASGGATLSTTTTTTNSFGLALVFVTSVGPGPGPVIVTATRADDPSASVQFTVNVLIPGLLKISGDFQSAPTSTAVPNPLVVEAVLNGAPQAGKGIIWTVTSGDAVISSVSNGGNTNAGGLSSATITFGPTEDTVVITATRADDPTVSQSFTLFATVTRTLGLVSGDNQTGAPNVALPLPLVVLAQNNGANAAGITILWSASNGATLSAASTVTGGTGQASVTVTNMGSSLGPVIVTATRADDPTATVSFTENINPPTFSIVSGNAQSGLVGTAAAAPMVVHLVDGGGNPVVGQTITWTVTSGSASVASFSSLTGPTGQASMTFTYGGFAGPITIQAGAYGGAVTVNFSETALAPGSVAKASGDLQTGAPGSTLAPFVIQIPACACSLAGVPVTFTITSSIGGTLSVISTVTNALGQASTQLTLGLTPGTVTVLAQVQGGPSTIFTATVSGVLVATTMTVVSGDLQALTPGVASAPMVVLLKAGAVPLAGMTISWGTTGGTLSAGSAVTDVNGNASVTVTESTPATISVTASFAAFAQYTASSATFTQNSTIAALAALTTNQVAVGVALDTACANLQVAAVLTPEQQDLLNQCLALTAAGGVAPAATEAAIDQMLPDVSETQNQTGQNAVTAQTTNISGRIQSLRNGSYGSSMGGLALTAAGGTIPLSSFATTLLNEDAPAKSEQTFDRWGFFASGNIGRGDAKAKALTPSYNLDIDGVTAGVDYRKSDTLILGTAIGFTRQNTDLTGGEGSVHMHGFSLSGYASWYHGVNWYLDSVVTFGWDNYRHVRRIDYVLPLPGGGSVVVNQFAKASAGGDDRSGSLTFGRDFHRQAWAFSVYGRGTYSVMGFNAFSEKLDNSAVGSGLALHVQSRSVTQLSSVLGGKVDYTHSTSWGVLLPHFELEWQHEFRGDPDNFVATFINDPTATPITVTGDAIDKSYFRFGVGLSVVMTHGRSGFVLYQRVLGQSGVSQENLSLGFRVEF